MIRARASLFLLPATLACLAAPVCAQDEAAHRDALYRATLAAAEANLALDRAAVARRWLDAAPVASRGWEWGYLRRLTDRSSQTVTALAGQVLDVDVSAAAGLVATAGSDGSVRLWRLDGEPVRDLEPHGKAVWDARFSPGGELLATQSSDGTARIYDVASGELRHRLEDVGRGVGGVAWHPGRRRLATCGWGFEAGRGVYGLVVEWSVETGERLARVEYGVKPLSTLSWDPAGQVLAVGSWDAEVALFATEPVLALPAAGLPPQLVPPESATYKAVDDLCFSADGAELLVTAKDGVARLWDVAGRRLVRTFGVARGEDVQPVWGVGFRGADQVVTAGGDGTLRLFDRRSGALQEVLLGHVGAVRTLVVVGDDLVSGGTDGTWRIWDVPVAGRDPARWKLADTAYDVAIAPGGELAASTGWGGAVEIRDVASGALVRSWVGHDESGVRCAWSPLGDRLVTTGNDGRIVVWDVEQGTAVRELLAAGRTQILRAVFSPDGSRVAGPVPGVGVRIWSLVDEVEPVTLALPETRAFDVRFDASGQRVLTGAYDGTLRVHDAADGAELHRVDLGADAHVALALSDDGRLCATAHQGVIRLHDATTAAVLREVGRHESEVFAMAFHPEGTRLASGSGDRSLRIWSLDGGDAELLRVAYGSPVWGLGWTEHGATLVAVPIDGTARVLRSR